MVIEKEIKYLGKIKQLDEENKLLREKILLNILSDNTEIARLNFKINELEKEIKYWKQKAFFSRLKEI